MGARGPKPLPSAIKIARGTFRADRAANEAQPIGKPTCPAWVTDADARKEFRRLVKLLSDMGLIGAADQSVIVRYACAFVRYRRMVTALMSNAKAEFATYAGEDGKVKAIQVSALNVAVRGLAEELSRYEAVLGMSPSARSRINVTASAAPAAEDDNARFFGPRLAS